MGFLMTRPLFTLNILTAPESNLGLHCLSRPFSQATKKPCVKQPLKNRQNKDLYNNW